MQNCDQGIRRIVGGDGRNCDTCEESLLEMDWEGSSNGCGDGDGTDLDLRLVKGV